MSQSQSVTFWTEEQGGLDEWSDRRRVLLRVETPDGQLSPWDDVTVRRDGDEFTASMEPVDAFGDPGGSHVKVESWAPEFESEPLDEDAFADAWGEWLFPADD